MSRILMPLIAFALMSCTQNAFLETAKRDTDAALLFEARKLMNAADWTNAIAKIQLMSTTAQATRETKTALASAYAGRCGLNLVSLADSISNAGSTNIFPVLLTALRSGNAAAITDCQSAETTILSIAATSASRTADENMLLAFVDFAKIGVILAQYADTNDDGSADVGFNSCNTGELPDAMLREIGTGLTIAVDSLSAAGGTVGSSLASSVTTACTTLAGVNPAFNFCAIQTTAGFSVDQVKALGGLVKSTDNPGLGTCAGDIATCVCP